MPIYRLFRAAATMLLYSIRENMRPTLHEVSFVETPKVQVADTVGAGDSFTAAFTAAILCGRSVREAHALAVETSAYVCTQQGAMPGLPERLTAQLA